MLTKRAPDLVGVLQTYRTIRRGRQSVIDEEQSLVKNHLKLSGVVKQEGTALGVRNAIYRKVFDPQWIQTHLPENLWQRLKPAMPLIAILLVFSGSMAVLAVYAVKQTVVAQLREQSARAQYLLTTPNAAQGLVLAIDSTARSKKDAPEVLLEAASILLTGVQTSLEQNLLQGHAGIVKSVAFSPDSRRIVSGSNDGSVRLWNAETGQPIGQPLQGYTVSVYSVAFSPDSRRIVSGSDDGSVRLWDADWSSWLAIACNRLRYHPLLNRPQTVVTDPDFIKAADRAKAICQQEVWGSK